MHVEPHRTAGQLTDLIRTESRARLAWRLTAVRLTLLDQTAAQVAAQALLSERQVHTGVACYNAGGPDALADRPGCGRKARSPPTGRAGSRAGCGPARPPPTGPALCAARTSAVSSGRSSASAGRSRQPTR
jgi:hypothetical protein